MNNWKIYIVEFFYFFFRLFGKFIFWNVDFWNKYEVDNGGVGIGKYKKKKVMVKDYMGWWGELVNIYLRIC